LERARSLARGTADALVERAPGAARIAGGALDNRTGPIHESSPVRRDLLHATGARREPAATSPLRLLSDANLPMPAVSS
jgi:hypothetical protein